MPTPAVPTGLTTFPETPDRIRLTWTASPKATGYDIERDGTVIATDYRDTIFWDYGLAPNSTHSYRVRASESYTLPRVLPNQISGLAGWWRADDIAVANGANVTSWTDRSSNANTMVAGTTPPTFQAQNDRLNGHPAVLFTAASLQTLTKTSPTGIPSRAPLTIVAVTDIPPGSNSAQGRIFDYSVTGVGSLGYGAGNIDVIAQMTTWGVKDYNGLNLLNPAFVFYRLNADFSMDIGRNNYAGPPNTTHNADIGGTPTILTFGARGPSNSTYFGGSVAEIMVFNRALTDAEIQQLATYAGLRYGISISKRRNAAAPLNLPSPDGTGQMTHPDVLYFPDGLFGFKYWMAITPYTNSLDDTENPCILVSQEGLEWSIPPGGSNPVIPPPGLPAYNSDTDLILIGSTLWMIYRVTGLPDNLDYIYAVSSTDGITWSTPQVILTGPFVTLLSPAVLFDGTQYVMYYVDNVTNVIGRRTAPDITGPWSAQVPTNVPFPNNNTPWHVNTIDRPGRIDLLVDLKQMQTGGEGDVYHLRWATSTDGLNFTMSEPIVTKSELGWDHEWIYRSAAILTPDQKTLRVWYPGAVASQWAVGYVELPFTDGPG